MTNNTDTNAKAIPTDPIERRRFFSAAKEEIVPLGRPVRKLPPRRNRRTSVPHRAIR